MYETGTTRRKLLAYLGTDNAKLDTFVLTFGSGRATTLQGAQHLAVFTAFIFLAAVP